MEASGMKNIPVMSLSDRHPRKIPPFCVYICIDARVDLRVRCTHMCIEARGQPQIVVPQGPFTFGGTESVTMSCSLLMKLETEPSGLEGVWRHEALRLKASMGSGGVGGGPSGGRCFGEAG